MAKPKCKRRKRPSSKSRLGNGRQRFKSAESLLRRILDRAVEEWRDGSTDYLSRRSQLHRYQGDE